MHFLSTFVSKEVPETQYFPPITVSTSDTLPSVTFMASLKKIKVERDLRVEFLLTLLSSLGSNLALKVNTNHRKLSFGKADFGLIHLNFSVQFNAGHSPAEAIQNCLNFIQGTLLPRYRTNVSLAPTLRCNTTTTPGGVRAPSLSYTLKGLPFLLGKTRSFRNTTRHVYFKEQDSITVSVSTNRALLYRTVPTSARGRRRNFRSKTVRPVFLNKSAPVNL